MQDERAPVTTFAELKTLDGDEIAEGYRDGMAGDPEPGGNRSKSYWHGWRNGRVDGKHAQPDAAMIELIPNVWLCNGGDISGFTP
jgi:hypothetical protein